MTQLNPPSPLNARGAKMKLEQIAGFDWCLLKTCPGVFRNGDGDFVIQGRTLAQGELNLSDVPDHESLVLIPRQVMEEAVRALAAD